LRKKFEMVNVLDEPVYCTSCGRDFDDIPQAPMFHDHVWKKLAKKNENLCIDCVLERSKEWNVTWSADDWTDCRLNEPWRKAWELAHPPSWGRLETPTSVEVDQEGDLRMAKASEKVYVLLVYFTDDEDCYVEPDVYVYSNQQQAEAGLVNYCRRHWTERFEQRYDVDGETPKIPGDDNDVVEKYFDNWWHKSGQYGIYEVVIDEEQGSVEHSLESYL
jgi:hypothetical protein